MVRLSKMLPVLLTALILGLALTLGGGSPAFASASHISVGQDTASGSHASRAEDACAQQPCSDHDADCVSGVAHCSGSAYTAFVAPIEAVDLSHSGDQTWSLEGTLRLSGLDPLVARHPPRDLA